MTYSIPVTIHTIRGTHKLRAEYNIIGAPNYSRDYTMDPYIEVVGIYHEDAEYFGDGYDASRYTKGFKVKNIKSSRYDDVIQEIQIQEGL